MKPIIRNLVSVARRFKLAATLNILGLSVAFAAFMVIIYNPRFRDMNPTIRLNSVFLTKYFNGCMKRRLL